MSKPQSPSLTIKRRFKAPAEKVFAAWTRPEALKAWFRPNDAHTVLVAETDVRVGGRYRLVAKDATEEHRVGGVYKEIVANRRLVFTWAWKQEDGSRGHETEVTITFEPVGKHTKLTLVQTLFAEEVHRDNHSKGWESSFNSLEKYLASA